MENITKKIQLQEIILEKVEKAHANFRKSPRDRITIGYVEGRLESLDGYWKEFKNAHDTISLSVSKESQKSLPYFTEDIYDSLEERYYTYKGELKTTLQKLSPEIKKCSQGGPNEPSKPSSSGMGSEIRLPHITIPTFGGNYTEWQSFHDLFLALVHKNSALEDVQKLHYLKANLKADAEVLLRQFAITGDNYAEAWSSLKRRYDNKRYIANSIFKKFFSQKALVQESATALRQLLDTSVECMNALKNLGLPTTQWDAIVNYVVVSKLDPGSHKHWEETISDDNSEEMPGFERLKSFLETRFRTLEMVEPVNKNYKPSNPKIFHVTTNNTNQDTQCALCKDNHYLFNCKQFAKKSVEDRYNFVQENNLCFNCLIPNHRVFHCKQKSSCQVCKRRHHSLLHRGAQQDEERKENKTVTTKKEDTKLVAHVRSRQEGRNHILLATALVDVQSRSGESHVCRALLDQGSEASFVTARLVEVLKLEKTPICGTISGVGEGNNVRINQKVELQITSRYETDFSFKVNSYVLKSLTRTLPAREVRGYVWPQLDDITLADPTFDTPGRIDILLGADVFGKIIDSGFLRGPGDVVAQYTHLGWILSGDINTNSFSSTTNITSFHVTRDVEEDNNFLKKFWEIETELYTNKKTWTKEEENCEESYNNTTMRDDTGRYIVHLPLKQSIEDTVRLCGDTKQQAIVRFKQLERRFDRNDKLKKEYAKVIHEYLELGHMKKAEAEEEDKAIYLPHHAVVREDRDTTKVRVVFDASAKGSNGHSLNNAMMIGPTLQPGLRSLIIRWRTHKICVVADVVKMYRQVWMTDRHTDLQRIVWRDNPSEKLENFNLLTVTFGTAAAPYLAVRTLNQLAEDEVHKYPRAAPVVKNSFYMDDLMTGHDNEAEVQTLCHEIRYLLKSGGFELQKWSSNSEDLLKTLQDEKADQETSSKIEFKLDKVIKILGLTWDRKDDAFKFTVNLPEFKNPKTKRVIISEVASLFDPFGWLAPVVVTAKVMIQRLWLCSLGWDDELPEELIEDWITYREELHELQTIEVPRWIRMRSNCKNVQLHGFADASSVAYAAVAYLRAVDDDGTVHVTMLAAKTKVAPLKQLTIPRLELCGAVLAAKLLRELSDLLEVPMDRIYAWTDSMVVLAWLQSQPSRWQVFVGNRVSDIIQRIDNDRWRHVQSADNPADLASRGVKASDLANCELWWNGPDWLKQNHTEFTRISFPNTELEAKRTFHCSLDQTSIWERFSSMSRLKRVIAQCRRFLNYRNKENKGEILTSDELNEVEEKCIGYYQGLVYAKEVEDLKGKGKISTRSSLISLNPFLDKNCLLRVGGRLSKANMSDYEKHPIIIPAKQHITKLIVKEAHIRTLHGDIQEMMSYIRTKYWIIGLKSAVRQCTHNCNICIRDKAKIRQQLMGQLPAQRVTPQRPFFNSGVDYAGPMQMRTSKGRGHKCTKGYICLFVCMSTRAIHLEAVTDLTSHAFIAAFRRFVARRGHCSHLWSDNGTNFVGASKELKQMFVQGKANVAREVAELLANDGTTWHFIPAKAPNFGGLWEAGVRSAKKHLTRINGTTKLTYEEMATLLAQIEACLNSRPLCRMDQSLDMLDPLTPGHFLIGDSVINIPDRNYEDRNIDLLSRWQLVQNRMQDFWKRWKSEYLNTLQQKYKWHKTVKSPIIGDIVIIKEDDLPPAKWLLGKVVALHPGSDQLVRVVTVQCKGNHVIKRPLNKLILLPTQPDE